MFKSLIQDERIVSISGTILLHAILVGLFLLITIDFRPVIEEFTEVTFAGGFEAPAMNNPPPTPDVFAEQSPEIEDVNPPIPENVELPERRQLELNEDEITEKVKPEPEKFINPGNVVKKSPEPLPPPVKTPDTSPEFTRREKQVERGLFKKQLDEKLLEGTQRVQVNPNRQFDITWEGEIEREVYQQRLPEFPPDVQREATIKIQFTVSPNGLVGSAVLLQKGDTQLENRTLEAFKSWRFNPLPEYAKQEPQTGVITFHYKLK
jgi:TonB family protein